MRIRKDQGLVARLTARCKVGFRYWDVYLPRLDDTAESSGGGRNLHFLDSSIAAGFFPTVHSVSADQRDYPAFRKWQRNAEDAGFRCCNVEKKERSC